MKKRTTQLSLRKATVANLTHIRGGINIPQTDYFNCFTEQGCGTRPLVSCRLLCQFTDVSCAYTMGESPDCLSAPTEYLSCIG
jgi:hypothetical protein